MAESNITITRQTVTLKQALGVLCNIYKKQYLQEVSGVNRNYYSMVLNGYAYGSVRELPVRYIQQLNDAVLVMGKRLSQTRITEEDTLSQIKALGKWVNLPHLFYERMGWTVGQLRGRTSNKAASTYGKFSGEQLFTINTHLMQMALETLQVQIALPVQENTDNKVETTAAVQGLCKKTD